MDHLLGSIVGQDEAGRNNGRGLGVRGRARRPSGRSSPPARSSIAVASARTTASEANAREGPGSRAGPVWTNANSAQEIGRATSNVREATRTSRRRRRRARPTAGRTGLRDREDKLGTRIRTGAAGLAWGCAWS